MTAACPCGLLLHRSSSPSQRRSNRPLPPPLAPAPPHANTPAPAPAFACAPLPTTEPLRTPPPSPHPTRPPASSRPVHTPPHRRQRRAAAIFPSDGSSSPNSGVCSPFQISRRRPPASTARPLLSRQHVPSSRGGAAIFFNGVAQTPLPFDEQKQARAQKGKGYGSPFNLL